jgi:hypothetical protein
MTQLQSEVRQFKSCFFFLFVALWARLWGINLLPNRAIQISVLQPLFIANFLPSDGKDSKDLP